MGNSSRFSDYVWTSRGRAPGWARGGQGHWCTWGFTLPNPTSKWGACNRKTNQKNGSAAASTGHPPHPHPPTPPLPVTLTPVVECTGWGPGGCFTKCLAKAQPGYAGQLAAIDAIQAALKHAGIFLVENIVSYAKKNVSYGIARKNIVSYGRICRKNVSYRIP